MWSGLIELEKHPDLEFKNSSWRAEDSIQSTLISSISHISCIWSVLHPYCTTSILLASVLSSSCPVLHPSCPAAVLSCIRPVLQLSCSASDLSCIRPVRHIICPASVLYCIRPVLHPPCSASILFTVQQLSCPASDLSCIQPDLHPSYCRFKDECRLHIYNFSTGIMLPL